MMKKMLLVLVCASFFLTGCDNLLVKSLIPEEIVEAAIDTNKDTEDYYIETTMKIYEGDKLTDESTIKEWSAKLDGQLKRRTEVVSEESGQIVSTVNNNELILYIEDDNEFYNFGDVEEVNPDLNKSLRDKTKAELDNMNNLYNMETIGEEKMNGVKTYHIKGKPKKESVLLGDYEMWIDKENWLVMKMIVSSGDLKVITENTKVDIAPKIDPGIFELDLPKDAKEITLQAAGENEKATIEDANSYLGNNLLVLKDESYKLEGIEYMVLDPEKDSKQFTFNYVRNAGKAFDISVMKTPEEGIAEMTDFGHEEREIRGNKAFVMDDILKMINFEEDGNYYILIAYDEEMTLDDMVELVEGMEKYK